MRNFGQPDIGSFEFVGPIEVSLTSMTQVSANRFDLGYSASVANGLYRVVVFSEAELESPSSGALPYTGHFDVSGPQPTAGIFPSEPPLSIPAFTVPTPWFYRIESRSGAPLFSF